MKCNKKFYSQFYKIYIVANCYKIIFSLIIKNFLLILNSTKNN